jgi:zinc transporter ZupT
MDVDAAEAFTEYFALAGPVGLLRDKHMQYPFSALIAVATFLILLMVDFLLVRQIDFGGSSSSSSSSRNGAASSASGTTANGHGHSHGAGGHSHAIPTLPADYGRTPAIEMTTPSSAVSGVVHVSPVVVSGPIEVGVELSPIAAETIELEKMRGSKQQVAQAWIFFVALSVHSIFDGLSVGSESSLSGFYALLVAVASHKLLDGFALGVPLFFARLPLWHTVFAMVFCSAMTPLGLGIAMAITSDDVHGQRGKLAQAIMLSMSFGSFIFISLVELLPAGLADGKWLKTKFMALFIGWGIMALIALWV